MKVPLKKNQKIKVSSAKDIYPIMQKILLRENKLNRKREHLWTIGLNEDRVIVYIELLCIGQENMLLVKVKDILRMAIYKDAAQIILVHNHPGGTIEPSAGDRSLTERLKHGGHFTDIQLLDHMIITEKRYFSFREKRILK